MNVLVTGSSRGIGKSIIELFASNGHNVIINYNKSDKEYIKNIESTIKEKYKVDVISVKCDVSSEEEVKYMFDIIKKHFSKLDCIVNNAGIAKDSRIEEKSSEEFLSVLKVNLLGTFLVSKYGYKLMDKGSIINIASNNVNHGFIESCDYDASKAGVVALTHDFARELAPNVRVNCVSPGWINTDMNKDLFESFKKEEEEKILLKRFGEAKDIANTVYFLATNEYINDEIVKVDGGYGY